ncbi:hypothetical protein [Streptomyces sp. ST2-7A]|uniref:hypothetical protein n=1 Tax=Streptomyces sp. ST2-7A TaxID=2907214 RepID=UPI001F456DE8|nr:hypothetical protein [Streptomyces sp. ST2-7A]MCE7079518.1 hypothetical protein [Streptomyces sp. ST2-7A]
MTDFRWYELTAELGPVWRDSNIRTGPSLSHAIVEVLLPDPEVSHRVEGWTRGDEVVEGENPTGVITSDVWIRIGTDRWSSAVNFHPDRVAELLPDVAPVVVPHASATG